jgi:hypothetical protein
MKKILCFVLTLLTIASCNQKPNEDEDFLLNLMKTEPGKFQEAIDNKDKYEVQIIYTQINRDENNAPSFKSFYFNVDSSKYFYPASTVKLPMLLISLEKLQRLNIPGLDKFTPMFSDSLYSGQISVTKDTTSENGLPSVAHYGKKILVVSDNDAYNRLYEFMGQKDANHQLTSKGYQMRLMHRLERPLSLDENRHTEAVRFVKDGKVIFSQPMLVNDTPIVVNTPVFKGKAFYRNDSLINKPFNFTYKNLYPLKDQQALLRALLFPNSVDVKRRFSLEPDNRTFVLKHMSQLPTETIYPSYSSDTIYYDAFCKFLMYGNSRERIPDNIRIFNKVGDAYGYMIDNAYIVDFDKGIEFMLSAVINTNTDEIYNDEDYEYDRLGFPFMKNLGQLIYTYEKQRNRERKPDLSEFKFEYDKKRK